MGSLVRPFRDIRISDVPEVGGKNASLGEMLSQLGPRGIRIPDGFATTAEAFWHFLDTNHLRDPLADLMGSLDRARFGNLNAVGAQARRLILEARLPADLAEAIREAYGQLAGGPDPGVAVRSSATAEDLPQASFAGQHESYLNIQGPEALLRSVQQCFASLYTDRAIKYREDNGFEHSRVALSVGVQHMVRSDLACSGVGFTLEPESGFRQVIHLAGVWGLGETIVQGTVIPDEFLLYKPALQAGKRSILQKQLGEKAQMLVYAAQPGKAPTVIQPVPADRRDRFVLEESEIEQLGRWALLIEQHYQKPMDMEWAKDGLTGNLFIVQARPETVHSSRDPRQLKEYELSQRGEPLAQGEAIGARIATGVARILHSPQQAGALQPGEIVVTDITSPDWDPVLKTAGAIVTNQGGRTSHASIVARELGVPAVVGTGNATQRIRDGEEITVSCAEGKTGFIYRGRLAFREILLDFSSVRLPDKTRVLLITGDPEKAFKLSFYPSQGVGLMRMEFIITHFIQVHPMALVNFDRLQDEAARKKIESLTRQYPDKRQYFVDRLAQGIATIAAAFDPREVIVRMSDFKSNEYANLLGGREFEPHEENPMLGFRGASRYYHERYREGFRLECEAIKRVRNEMGLTGVKVMIPFCRTVEEGTRVVAAMEEYGLKRGENGLEIYVMAEIPSNVLLAEEFARVFDGFSIGSNDLTQLTLGIDRDSALVAGLFSESNPAAKQMISQVIAKARACGRPIGLCGQAPSDFPEFARFLVEQGIDSISFNPDAILKGIENIRMAEAGQRTSP